MVVLFNLLIGVHELGHFWRRAMAWAEDGAIRHLVRQADLERGKSTASNTRSAGFPPAVTSRCRKWPRWRPSKADGKPPNTLPNAPPLDKIIVAFAGPLFMNVFFAFAIAALIYFVGMPVPDSQPIIGMG